MLRIKRTQENSVSLPIVSVIPLWLNILIMFLCFKDFSFDLQLGGVELQ